MMGSNTIRNHLPIASYLYFTRLPPGQKSPVIRFRCHEMAERAILRLLIRPDACLNRIPAIPSYIVSHGYARDALLTAAYHINTYLRSLPPLMMNYAVIIASIPDSIQPEAEKLAQPGKEKKVSIHSTGTTLLADKLRYSPTPGILVLNVFIGLMKAQPDKPTSSFTRKHSDT